MSEQVSVSMSHDEQAIAMFVGRGEVLIARDNQDSTWVLTPTQRAVLAARLRAVADRVEDVTP